MFLEIYHSVIEKLNAWAEKYKQAHDIEVVSIFLLPLAFEEVDMIAGHTGLPPEEILYRLVSEKMRRCGRDPDEEIERQAREAWTEMQSAALYNHRIVCNHGEDEVEAWTGRFLAELHPYVQLVVEQFHALLTRHPDTKKFVILSGPSCTGKGPLWATFSRLYL